jgi:hypothetical protein
VVVRPEPTQFRRLRDGLGDGRLTVAIDRKRLSHMDCPVAADALATQALYGMVAIAAIAFWLLPSAFALGCVAGTLLAYAAVGHAWVGRRMERLALSQMLDNQELWDRMWRFGGVHLTAAAAAAHGPDDDWRALVDRVLPPEDASDRRIAPLSLEADGLPG